MFKRKERPEKQVYRTEVFFGSGYLATYRVIDVKAATAGEARAEAIKIAERKEYRKSRGASVAVPLKDWRVVSL